MTLTNFPNGLAVGDLEITEGGISTITSLLGTGRINLEPQVITATANGVINPDVSHVNLSHATVAIAATRVAPTAGDVLIIINTSASGTAAHTVTLPTGVTWDGTNRIATLNAPGEALICVADSVTRYRVLVNLGSVGFSSP